MESRQDQIRFCVVSLAYFAGLTALFFYDALLDPHWVISAPGMDIDNFFYPLRTFAFAEMREGNLPLWNPYILGGIPALGNTLYALLYPPNWLHLILPMGFTINLLIAIHMMLTGLFTAVWCRTRGASTLAALVGGTVFMLCGANTLRVYGGYLTHACIIIWTPLLFICIDRIIEDRRPGLTCLAGAAIVALQIDAGYMQPTYFQFFGVCTYVVVRLINHPRSARTLAWLAAMFALGAGLCAVQFVLGIDAAAESVRGGFERFSFSTSFSLPPENLLTAITPFPFGDWVNAQVFARWGLVDTSIFMGTVGTSLALLGAIRARTLRDKAAVVTAIAMLILAMGGYTPLYRPLLAVVPGLELFRFPSRFAFIACFMAAPLASAGFDYLRQSRRIGLTFVTISIAAVLFAIAALIVAQSATPGHDGVWSRVLHRLVATDETWPKLDKPDAPFQIAQNAHFASQQFATTATTFAIIALIIWVARKRPAAMALLLGLLAIELYAGSSLMLCRFRPTMQLPLGWNTALAQRHGDERALVLTTGEHNLPMQFRFESIGGYDPAVRQRWDSAVRRLLGAESRTGNLNTRRVLPSSRWPMFRLGALVPPNDSIQIDPPLARLNLLEHFTITTGPDESLLAIREVNFDPRKSVVLETPPVPAPEPVNQDTPPGMVQVVHITTDSIEFTADLVRPSILLVTDAYSKGWRAVPVEPGPQTRYEVLPANHALRAIPLAAGKHHVRLEYRPKYLSIAMGANIASIVGWLFGLIAVSRRPKMPHSVEPRISGHPVTS